MLIGEVLAAFRKAYRLRHEKEAVNSVLPPVASSPRLSQASIDRIFFRAKIIVSLFLFWKPGRCVYRAVALASVLRKRGLPLALNFGWKYQDESHDNIKAHCWLDLNGEPFAEKSNPFPNYPNRVGSFQNDAHYWVGDGINKRQRYRKVKRCSGYRRK